RFKSMPPTKMIAMLIAYCVKCHEHLLNIKQGLEKAWVTVCRGAIEHGNPMGLQEEHLDYDLVKTMHLLEDEGIIKTLDGEFVKVKVEGIYQGKLKGKDALFCCSRPQEHSNNGDSNDDE